MGTHYNKDPLAILDDTQREIVHIHNCMGSGCARIDDSALEDIATAAEHLNTTARALGWNDLGDCATQIFTMARVPPDTVVPVILRSRLGHILFQMDRQIVERRRLLHSS
jgi:hypothetical protein